jgi:uncharacterized repeat protein (TIGR01451 family)
MEEMQDELKAIYEQDGNMPNLTKLERRQVSPLTRFLGIAVGVLSVLAVVAWGGFFVWTRGWFASSRPLNVSLEGPEHAAAGQVAFFTARYENTGSVPIASIDMSLNLPLGFEVLTTDPAPTEGTTWKLNSLSGGSDGSIVISGIFHSEVPSSETLQAFFTYRPGNYSTDFQEIATKLTNIDDSVIHVAVTGPEKALSGDEVTYTVEAQNAGAIAVGNFRLIATLPTGFTVTSAEPASRPDLPEWDIATLEPGAITTIIIKGKYTATTAGSQTFGVRSAVVSEDDTLLTQATSQVVTDVLGGNLAFHLIVDGSTSNVAANLGEPLRVSVDYTNAGNEAIGGLSLTLKLDGSGRPLPVDWEKADLGVARRDGSTIIWDENAIPEFASLAPNATDILDLTLPLLGELDPALIADQFTATLAADLDRVGSVESPRTVETSPVTVAINSDFAASGEVRYFTDAGEPVGTGALPPQVGKTTTYRVYWDLKNSMHPLSGIVMSTNLPPDVAWVGNAHADIGTIAFDETTRLVTWSADKLPADIPAVEATFDVAITPQDADIGAYFKLTNATSADATDDTTKAHLSNALDILTTELPTDETAKGKGVVVE